MKTKYHNGQADDEADKDVQLDHEVRGKDNPLVVDGLKKFAKNIAEQMTEEQRKTLGRIVVEDVEEDLDSRKEDMESRWERWAELYVGRPRQSPLAMRTDAPNVHTGAAAVAVDQYSARCEKYLFPPGRIAKAIDKGREDSEAAWRVAYSMNTQIEHRIPRFRMTGGKGVKQSALFGLSAWKTWWNEPHDRHGVSVVPAEDFIISHTHNGSLEDALRLTERMYLSRDFIRMRIDEGVYCDDCWDVSDDSEYSNEDEGTGQVRNEADGWSRARDASEDGAMEVYEQHRGLDLDGDGIMEPYVVLVHKDSRKVLRITSRTVKRNDGEEETLEFYTPMPFDHNPLGFYPLGILAKTEGLQVAQNSLMNLMLFKGIRESFPPKFCTKKAFKNPGETEYEMDDWIEAEMGVEDLGKNMFIAPVNPLSGVIPDMYREVTRQIQESVSVTDVMQGKEQPHNQAATTTKIVRDESMELFNGSFRRMLDALTEVLSKLARLNRLYLSDDVYNNELLGGDTGQAAYAQWEQATAQWEQLVATVLGQLDQGMQPDPQLLMQMMQSGPPPEYPFTVASDYSDEIGIYPTADPNLTTEGERQGVAEAVLQLTMQDPQVTPRQMWAARKQHFDALRVPASVQSQVNPEPQEPQPPPNKDQLTENADAMRGQPMFVLPDQDHAEHVRHIEELEQLPEKSYLYNNMPPEAKEALAQHKREHLAILMDQEARGQGNAIQALSNGASGGEANGAGADPMGGAPGGVMVPGPPGVA